MSMKIGLIIAIILIAVIIGGIFFYQKTVSSSDQSSGSMKKTSNEMVKEGTMQKENATTLQPTLLAGTTTPYYEFSQEPYNKALKENKTIFLYFFANWCPICAKEQKEATLPAFNELQNANIVGFRVHYNDNAITSEEKELAKQFGITYQHTKVILKDGKQIKKDLNSWDEKKYLTELNQL